MSPSLLGFPSQVRCSVLTCAVACLLGCAVAELPGAASRADRGEPKLSGSALIAEAHEAPSENGGSQADREQPRSVLAAAHKLEVPRLDGFLQAPLPEPRPERYASFRESSRIQVGKGYLHQLALFPDERYVLVASDEEATVRVYDNRTKQLLGNYGVPGWERFAVGGVLAWPEGPLRFIAGTPLGILAVDARTGSTQGLLDDRPVRALRWSKDLRVLVAQAAAAPSESSILHFFARSAGLERLGSLTFEERVDGWDLSPDNRHLAVTYYPSGDLHVIDLYTGETSFRVPGPRYAGDVAFSPDGRLVAVGGAGLLLVDRVNPARRAFYSHLYNNIAQVRFSPSGDAVAASSFDGCVRLLAFDAPIDGAPLSLRLVQTLRHAGQANVYAFAFEADGQGLVSASGDQTLRTFRGPSPARAKAGGSNDSAAVQRRFMPLEEWRRRAKEAARPLPEPPDTTAHGHYFPRSLLGPPRASRITPGRYACKIDHVYKLRDCWVRRDSEGHTLLEFAKDNLLGLKGVLYDDGPVVRFEGWLTEPSTVVGCPGCEKQPLHAVFRGAGKSFTGLLVFRNYYDAHSPPELPAADVKFEAANDRFPLVLQFREPLPGSVAEGALGR